MEERNINKFFETLGEIWRDITLIEFLMRGALAQKEGDVDKLPKPPYKKGKVYIEYPKSFLPVLFGDVALKFNKEFPSIAIPQELIDLRNAMAHGFIAEINNSGIDEIVKFRRQKDDTLMVEFSMTLEQQKIAQIRQSLHELKKYIMLEAEDKPKG